MPLATAPNGETMTVVKVEADTKTKRHLQSLGIMTGAEVVPLSYTDGNMIIKIHDSRIALNRETAECICVRKAHVFA